VCTGPNCVATGIGTLAPEGTSVPVWATMLAALGVTGVFIGLGLMGSRVFRRRD
jgi:pyridoxal biosynthesis lyase PdxS